MSRVIILNIGWSLCTHKSTGTVGWLPTSFLKKNDDSGEIELGFAATIAPGNICQTV